MRKKFLTIVLLFSAITVCACTKNVPDAPSIAEEKNEEVQEEESEEAKEEGPVQIPQILIANYKLSAPYHKQDSTAVAGDLDVVALDEKSALLFPELAKNLENDWNAATEEYLDEFDTIWEDTLFYEENVEDVLYEQGAVEYKSRVYRNDGTILTVLTDYYDYAVGSTHGIYGRTAKNYTTATGEALDLYDVWTGSKDDLYDTLTTRLFEENPEVEFDVTDLRDAIQSAMEWDGYSGWYLGTNSLHFYFQPYDLASYANGAFETELPFTEYADFIKEEYRQPAEGLQVFEGGLYDTCMEFDVDGDGSIDPITALPIYDEEAENVNFTDGITFTIGDEVLEADLVAETVCIYYVFDGNGPLYIYVESGGDATVAALYVFEYNGKSLRYLDTYPGVLAESLVTTTPSFLDRLSEEVAITTKCNYVFSNPKSFYLQIHINPLSTTDGLMEYEIGSDGRPNPLSDSFRIIHPFDLTTLTEVEAEAIEEKTTVIIPPEETITIVATDAATYVDAKLKDGTLVRIPCDLSWPQTVADQSAEDVFEGIFYDE